MDDMNSAFKAMANQVEAEERERANRRGSGSYSFENVRWSGLEKGQMKIVRALGGVPNSGENAFTARTVRIANIINDKGKKIEVHLPPKEENSSWILWKAIDRVMDIEWVDKKKVYPVERSNPDIFNIVAHNGFPAGSPQWKYDKGWSGREYFVFNCIDRDPETYTWSQKNKHCVLLSKQVNTVPSRTGGDPMLFAEKGIPAYGFVSLLAMNIFKHYGDWRNYDLGITKTGLMETPVRVINASKYIEEVPEELQPLVVNGPLTDEEKTWAMYDLDKHFGVTSYTKLWNNLKLTFARIDSELGTHFMEELKDLANDEAAKRAASKTEEKEEEEEAEEVPDVQEEEEPVATRPARQEVSTGAVPPNFDKLSEEEKKLIVSGHQEGTSSKWTIKYADSTSKSKKYACTGCGTVVPEEFTMCPVCGIRW